MVDPWADQNTQRDIEGMVICRRIELLIAPEQWQRIQSYLLPLSRVALMNGQLVFRIWPGQFPLIIRSSPTRLQCWTIVVMATVSKWPPSAISWLTWSITPASELNLCYDSPSEDRQKIRKVVASLEGNSKNVPIKMSSLKSKSWLTEARVDLNRAGLQHRVVDGIRKSAHDKQTPRPGRCVGYADAEWNDWLLIARQWVTSSLFSFR